jgi:hypothetical protein
MDGFAASTYLACGEIMVRVVFLLGSAVHLAGFMLASATDRFVCGAVKSPWIPVNTPL